MPPVYKCLKPHYKQAADFWKCDEAYIKIKGKWHYLYRAIDKHGTTLDWMLSRHRNKISAKQFFKKVVGNSHAVDPRVITVDKSPTFPSALSELQAANDMPRHRRLRPIKYLNNSMENNFNHIMTLCRIACCKKSITSCCKSSNFP